MKITKLILIITFLLPFTIKASKNQEPKVLYNPKFIKFNLCFSVFNYTKDSSILFIKIFPKELLYSYLNAEGKYKAQLKIHYIINEFDENSSKIGILVDSSSLVYDFYREGIPNEIIKKIQLYTPYDKFYSLKIVSTDLIRKHSNVNYILINKKIKSHQDILLYLDSDTIPIFYPYNLRFDSFKIKINNYLENESLYLVNIENYKNPVPIFKDNENFDEFNNIVKKYLSKINYGNNIIKLPNYGFYMLLFDTISLNGISIIYKNSTLPKTNNLENLINPIIYITTTNEYLQILNSTNKKLAIDNFWLKISKNNKEKAREIIRIYYNRVAYANQFFTSYKPGWQTDRGMIYIIFGVPDMVISQLNEEKWIYFKNTFNNKVEFEFYLNILPFSNNNFILKRSPEYEFIWREAINSWRNGKIYSF